MIHPAFLAEDYHDVKGHLMAYRLDDKIIAAEAKSGKNKGIIFTFARGLRFSALLIYKIRKILNGTNLTASWGQIINDDGTFSNECDIIIHETGYVQRWNGEGGIMDFNFISQSKAKAVVSCKSYIKTNTIEKEYFQNLSQYVPKIWLFAECCPKSSLRTIRANARSIGYEHFWHLYTFDKKQVTTQDAPLDEWKDFHTTVRALANS
jgi:hypothetical protein